MNYTLFDLFLNAYNGNSFAQLQIVQRFQPLLKKYAALLKYEDAYSDLQLYLLELLHSGKLTKLQRKDDGTLVKYIESSIRHQYISLNSRKNAVDNSVIASVDEIDFNQMSLSSNDEYSQQAVSGTGRVAPCAIQRKCFKQRNLFLMGHSYKLSLVLDFQPEISYTKKR